MSRIFFLPIVVGLLLSARATGTEAEPIGIEIKEGVKIVYHIKVDDVRNDQVSKGVAELLHLVNLYEEDGVPEGQRTIDAVFDADAVPFALQDSAYAQFGRGDENPNAPLIAELIEKGVSIEVCGQRLEREKLTADELLPGVEVAVSGQMRVIDLQLRDFAYFRF